MNNRIPYHNAKRRTTPNKTVALFYYKLIFSSSFLMKVTFMEKTSIFKIDWSYFLDSDIRKQSMSKNDHFNAPFQLTSAENVKAIEFKLSQALDETFSFLYIQLVTCFAITIGAKCKLEVNQ